MGVRMLNNLTESAAASSKTLDAFAELICALAPEVCSVSFHDFAADTLLLSEDFLLPEDHQLVEDCLARDADRQHSIHYGTREGTRFSMAIPVRDTRGEVIGAVRLSIDSQIADAAYAGAAGAAPRARHGVPGRRIRAPPCAARTLPAADEQQLVAIEQCARRRALRALSAAHPIVARGPGTGPLRSAAAPAHERGLAARAAHVPQGRRAPQSHALIDRWVVRTLLMWLVNNRQLWSRAPAVFSINVSSQSMTDAGFVSFVESCVSKSGLPPQMLCFEITERFASSGNISVAESMKRLEALGCEVALDDFGANAPSYGYLRTVPAHYFKIDSSLVVRRAQRPRGARRHLLDRAHGRRSRRANGRRVGRVGFGAAGHARAGRRLRAGLSRGQAAIAHGIPLSDRYQLGVMARR